MEPARCFTAIIKNTHTVKWLHNKFHSLALCLRIVSIKSNIIQQGCFRHKQMLQRMFNIIRNSLSKRKKNTNYQDLSSEIHDPSTEVHFVVKLLFSKPLLYFRRGFYIALMIKCNQPGLLEPLFKDTRW